MNTTLRIITALTVFGAGLGCGLWIAGMPHDTEHADTATTTHPGERKPLYYRNPMGQPDISPVPKQDSMGMDYIPVYAEDLDNADTAGDGLVRITPQRVQRAGVRSEPAALRVLERTVIAPGVVETNERTEGTVAPRFDGWIDTLQVSETGRAVRRGEVLFTAYSPELLVAQQDYLIARDATRIATDGFGSQLLDTARSRLLNLQFDAAQIRELERQGSPLPHVAVRAPTDGVVLEKQAVAGLRFAAGTSLYRLADLRTLWLIASVHEHDMSEVQVGQHAELRIDGLPGESFDGMVDFIYPTVDRSTRTVRVRIELPNPRLRLQPGMFGRVELHATSTRRPVLTVPESALIDSGLRQLVLVEHESGRFEPRTVAAGQRGNGYVEILSGLESDEPVVVRASFLIDAESNLRAALEGFSTPDGEVAPGAASHHHHGH